MKLTKIKIRKLAVVAIVACTLLYVLPWPKRFDPTLLPYTDLYHAWRVLFDKQNFPVDTEPIEGDNSTIVIPIDINISTHTLNMFYLTDKREYAHDPLLKYFMPVMSLSDWENLLYTTETFVRVCEKANLTYFFFVGSLLGAYRHHGIIPWDDDIDVVMNASDWRKIRNVLSRVEGYELLARKSDHWKFFKKDSLPASEEPFKWPFLDIFFFTEDATHVWGLSKELEGDLVHRKDEIFPLQLRVFEHIRVAVPCKMEEIVLTQFRIQDCCSPTGSHLDGKGFDSSRIKNIPCQQLYTIFPFVFRHKDPNSGTIIETLKIGDTVLRNVSEPAS